MRDFFSWSIPLFRVFGIPVRLHVLYLLVTVPLFLRSVALPNASVGWIDALFVTMLIPFGVILLHELGHCYGGRSVGGSADQIVMWPLGGLAMVSAPHNPRAHLITVAAGPAVNLIICLVCGGGMVAAGFLPNMVPWANPYVSEVKSYQDGRTYTSEYGGRFYNSKSEEANKQIGDALSKSPLPTDKREYLRQSLQEIGYEAAVAPGWVVWLQRIFWFSWANFLFNVLILAYPLDGGQLLQGFIWARSSYEQGTRVMCYSGYVFGFLIMGLGFVVNESLFVGLGTFMFVMAMVKMYEVEQDRGEYGDFSQGYTSLERDDPPAPRRRRPNVLKRWWQARKARQLQREVEQRIQDEGRMDELLDKIARLGKASLTDEERRFMERVSARYRNKP